MKTLNELMNEKNRLQDRLNRIRRDLRLPLDADSSEQAVELENRDVLIELERVESQNLAKIEQEISKLQR